MIRHAPETDRLPQEGHAWLIFILLGLKDTTLTCIAQENSPENRRQCLNSNIWIEGRVSGLAGSNCGQRQPSYQPAPRAPRQNGVPCHWHYASKSDHTLAPSPGNSFQSFLGVPASRHSNGGCIRTGGWENGAGRLRQAAAGLSWRDGYRDTQADKHCILIPRACDLGIGLTSTNYVRRVASGSASKPRSRSGRCKSAMKYGGGRSPFPHNSCLEVHASCSGPAGHSSSAAGCARQGSNLQPGRYERSALTS